MTRIALGVEYFGQPFHGWQSQAGGGTVQDALEAALAAIAGEPVAALCAGRTDAGVHAIQQVVHFDTAARRPLTAWVRGVNSHLPEGVVVITAGVDTQDDRLEVEFVGWGRGEESWSLDYRILHGDTTKPEVWDALDKLLLRRWRHVKAVPDLHVAATAIDSGGHRTGQVVAFSGARLNRRVWAIKGRGGPGVSPWPRRPPKPKRQGLAPIHIVGVDGVKSTLMARLRMGAPEGPGVAHFPDGRDHDWFVGLLAERAVRKWKAGVARIWWVADPNVRNEPLDCRVYACAALAGLTSAGLNLAEAARVVSEAAERKGEAEAEPVKPVAAKIRSNWLGR